MSDSDEVFTVRCRPQALRQFQECVTEGTPDRPHAVHRELGELELHLCNCGYASGWRPVGELPLASDFIMEHWANRGDTGTWQDEVRTS